MPVDPVEPASLPPSGRQFEISLGAQRAWVGEVGAVLRAYEWDGQARLDGFAVEESVTGARGQPLVPWPNRLGHGRYDWEGQSQQVPLNEPEKSNAIHGLLRWQPYRLVEHSATAVELGALLPPQPGWPQWLQIRLHYSLSPAGLTVRTVARNLGDGPCPYGAGAHPYLTVGTPTVDDCLLQVRADAYITTDERQLPTGTAPVAGTDYDFREPRRIGATKVDFAFTELHRDADGRFRTRLTGPDGRSVALWQDEAYRYVEIFTGDTLPPRKRRTGVGVEPMTMPPNGLQTGTDVVRLEPGQSHEASWGIEVQG